MNKLNWEFQSLDESKWGPSPLEDLVNLWVKLQALNLGHVEKPKFYYISEDEMPEDKWVYTFTGVSGIKISVFHSRFKSEILQLALENGWQPVDYADFCKTNEWKRLFEQDFARLCKERLNSK